MDTTHRPTSLLPVASTLTLLALVAGCEAASEGASPPPAWQVSVEADLRAIETALERFAALNAGRYPEDLQVLVTPDAGGATYLRRTTLPVDPWSRTYLYEPPDAARPRPRVLTLGRDGRPGGTGEDGDVDNLGLARG